MSLKSLVKWSLDWRIWGVALFWIGLAALDLRFGGDFRTSMVRTINIAVLVAQGMSIFFFVNATQDATFLPDRTWRDSWDNGNQLAVAVIFLANRVFSGLVAAAIVNPF